MQYIIFTFVDAITGIGVDKTPATNSTKFPEVADFRFVGTIKSQSTPQLPKFFGICGDQTDLPAEGVLEIITKQQYNLLYLDYLYNTHNITETISARQLRLILLKLNLLDRVTTVVSTMSPTLQIEWEYATVVNRSSELINAITETLDLTPMQVVRIYYQGNTL